jgi:hypothetical protein
MPKLKKILVKPSYNNTTVVHLVFDDNTSYYTRFSSRVSLSTTAPNLAKVDDTGLTTTGGSYLSLESPWKRAKDADASLRWNSGDFHSYVAPENVAVNIGAATTATTATGENMSNNFKQLAAIGATKRVAQRASANLTEPLKPFVVGMFPTLDPQLVDQLVTMLALGTLSAISGALASHTEGKKSQIAQIAQTNLDAALKVTVGESTVDLLACFGPQLWDVMKEIAATTNKQETSQKKIEGQSVKLTNDLFGQAVDAELLEIPVEMEV